MRILPDTSVWVDYLRHGERGGSWPLDGLLQGGSVVVCGPIVAELLAGAQPPDRDALWVLLQALPWAPLGTEEWARVGGVSAALRERGMTVPLTDVEIAVAAVAGDASLWTRDSDFDRVASVLPELRRYRPGGT